MTGSAGLTLLFGTDHEAEDLRATPPFILRSWAATLGARFNPDRTGEKAGVLGSGRETDGPGRRAGVLGKLRLAFDSEFV